MAANSTNINLSNNDVLIEIINTNDVNTNDQIIQSTDRQNNTILQKILSIGNYIYQYCENKIKIILLCLSFILHLLFVIIFSDIENNKKVCIIYQENSTPNCGLDTFIINLSNNIIIITVCFINIVFLKFTPHSFNTLKYTMYTFMILFSTFTYFINKSIKPESNDGPLSILNFFEFIIIIAPFVTCFTIFVFFYLIYKIIKYFKKRVKKMIEFKISDPIDEDCSICKNSLLTNSPVITECKHVFHSECIYKFINEFDGNNCPNCRTSF